MLHNLSIPWPTTNEVLASLAVAAAFANVVIAILCFPRKRRAGGRK